MHSQNMAEPGNTSQSCGLSSRVCSRSLAALIINTRMTCESLGGSGSQTLKLCYRSMTSPTHLGTMVAEHFP